MTDPWLWDVMAYEVTIAPKPWCLVHQPNVFTGGCLDRSAGNQVGPVYSRKKVNQFMSHALASVVKPVDKSFLSKGQGKHSLVSSQFMKANTQNASKCLILLRSIFRHFIVATQHHKRAIGKAESDSGGVSDRGAVLAVWYPLHAKVWYTPIEV